MGTILANIILQNLRPGAQILVVCFTNHALDSFIEGILKFGNDWKKVQNIIKTRSSTQARSHAQKFFLKLKKEIKSDILLDKDKGDSE